MVQTETPEARLLRTIRRFLRLVELTENGERDKVICNQAEAIRNLIDQSLELHFAGEFAEAMIAARKEQEGRPAR